MLVFCTWRVKTEAIKVCNTFVLSDAEKDKIKALKEKVKDNCEPRKNLPYTRHMFFTKAQGPTETIDAYVTELKSKAKDCEFGLLHDSLIRDRIVCGIRDDSVRRRLLREADLTLEKAIDVCRANEITSSQVKMLNEEVEVHKIRPVNTAKTERAEKGRTKPASQDEQKGFDCNRCGYKHEYKKCPAFGQTCKSCQKKNHFAKMCKAQGHTRKMHAVEQSDSDHNMFIGTINVEQEVCIKKIDNAEMEDGDEWTEELKINRRKVKFKLDTGAGCNVMSADTFNSLDIGGKLKKSTCRLVAYFATSRRHWARENSLVCTKDRNTRLSLRSRTKMFQQYWERKHALS